MKEWTRDEWDNIFNNPPTNGNILATDVHRAQQPDPVKRLLQSKKTILVNVPPRSTSRFQPLDIVINKPFKNAIKEQFERHLGMKTCMT